MKTILAATLGGLLLSNMALANDCRQQLPDWIEQAHPGYAPDRTLQDERGDYRVDADESICKVWPARTHLTLVASRLVREEHEGYGEADLEVMVFDTARHTLLARRVEPNLLNWDALRVDDIAFDTALYRLRGDDLAFGVRISWRGNWNTNLFQEDRLNLYELDGQHLHPLLHELPVRSVWGHWDEKCAGEFNDAKRVLILTERVGNNGYRDLLFKQARVESRHAQVAGECKIVERSTHRAEFPIEYGEDRYLLPIEFVSEPGVP